MKIPNSPYEERVKDNQDTLKRLNQGLEKKIANKEAEIKQVGEHYDLKIELSKQEGEDKYLKALDRNQQRIIGESNEFEEKINNYRDQLTRAQQAVENEKVNLKTHHQKDLTTLKDQLDNHFQDEMANTMESQRDIVTSSQNKVKELSAQAKVQKLAAENSALYEINALTSAHNQKGIDVEKDFQEQLRNNLRNHTADLAIQKNDLNNNLAQEINKHKRIESEQTRVQQEQLSYMDKHQQELLRQRQSDFKVRYEKMAAEHDEILKNLEKNFNDDVQKIANKSSTEKRILNQKSEDQFYQIDRLNPKITETPKEVIVSLPVPEYEKENVHISAQGRNIKITLGRKFSENLTSPEGVIDRSTRSELYSKEINTVDIMSPKKVVQHYEDGVLTFKIQKA